MSLYRLVDLCALGLCALAFALKTFSCCWCKHYWGNGKGAYVLRRYRGDCSDCSKYFAGCCCTFRLGEQQRWHVNLLASEFAGSKQNHEQVPILFCHT